MPPKKRKSASASVKSISRYTGGDDDDEVRRRQTAARRRRRRRKRRKHGGNNSGYLLPFLIIPKNKLLARQVVIKLQSQIYAYKISRAVHAMRKIQRFAKTEEEHLELPTDREENEWKRQQQRGKGTFSKIKILEDRIDRIRERAAKRRKKKQDADQEELYRRRYRVHPQDPEYSYKPGYRKVRHRITKDRFMRFIDVSLFLQVLKQNQELLASPLWQDSLNLAGLNHEDVRKLRGHMEQFEVIQEALKQGLFDDPAAKNRVPLDKVRRKKDPKRSVDLNRQYLRWLSKYKHTYKKKRTPDPNSRLKRKISFPPIYIEPKPGDGSDFKPQGWFNLVTNWIKKEKVTEGKDEEEVKEIFKGPRRTELESRLPSMSKLDEQIQKRGVGADVKRRKSSIKLGIDFPASLIARLSFGKLNPFYQFLTINVPKNLEKRKLFIHTLVESKMKKEPKPHIGIDEEEMAQEQELRKLRVERKDPLQRLHQDEQDSDIWTDAATTTTDDYASWRRIPKLKKEETSQSQDKTFHWRLLLTLIVMWELVRGNMSYVALGIFLKRVIDDVYYSILTFHLYRESIWLSDTHISSPDESYIIMTLVDWIHLLISIVSLSIIQKKNECLSLLFAFSLLIHGTCDIAKHSHDALLLKDGLSIFELSMLFFQAVYKGMKICLFIAYHYHSADYIRKFREFKHRKTKLHNHEINAKGTKGLMKRRLAWNWMTRRARIQTLKQLKAKYPDVKDGNFPEDGLDKEIKFVEAKELRLYAQRHNLNLGYPYNSLKDMKRYVFGESEKSDYTEDDEDDERTKKALRRTRDKKASTEPLTFETFRRWKKEQASKAQEKVAPAPEPGRKSSRKSSGTGPLTIAPRLSNADKRLMSAEARELI